MMKTTKRVWIRSCFLVMTSVVALFCCVVLAAAKVERTSAPPPEVSDALRSAVNDKGYRVTLDDGWTAEFWFVHQLKLEKKEAPGSLYPELADGEFIGVVKFTQAFSDYRGQSVAAGTYTLRYQLLPQDGNHMGVAPNPDFLLLIPASADARPEQAYVFRKLVTLSAKSTGGEHPAVVAMESAGKAGTVVTNDKGEVVFSADLGSKETLAIVIKGTAAQ